MDAALNCETWNHQRDEEKSGQTQNWPPKVKLVEKVFTGLKSIKRQIVNSKQKQEREKKEHFES